MLRPPFNSLRVIPPHQSRKGFTLPLPVFCGRISVYPGMPRHTKTRQCRGLMLNTITPLSVFPACVLVGILSRQVRQRRKRQDRAWYRSLPQKYMREALANSLTTAGIPPLN
ncbi:hypothetical protein PISMIDRAFT_511025 [Pisolithus microcarpus 441]|uniref:Unplaced genomic scaffold scaffold_58, whole genome shotgun sequence n=1 Tax=Pisolithus microcarpus 441 TaxID=765257 RepID=A0A0C9ZI91_9AGAM|nr:hypothetical protein PISMIDRAFT_511025 [Pisolithus microcarpus 441]